MDDLNLYDDLDEFQEQQDKKSKELQAAEEKYQQSLQHIEELKEENKALKKNIKRIELGFQSLLDTARSEIKRKDKEIERLRKEKDDICFRRKLPSESAHTIVESKLDNNFSVCNPFKQSDVARPNELSVAESVINPTAVCEVTNEKAETNKRNRVNNHGSDKLDSKRHRSNLNDPDDKYLHNASKYHKTDKKTEDGHNRSRTCYREIDRNKTYKESYHRNHSRDRGKSVKTYSKNNYEKSKESSERNERFRNGSQRSRSRERDKFNNRHKHFKERNRSPERHKKRLLSKSSSKSPSSRKKFDGDSKLAHVNKRKRETENSKKSFKDLGEENITYHKTVPKNLTTENMRLENENKSKHDTKQTLKEEKQTSSTIIPMDELKNKSDNGFNKEENNGQHKITDTEIHKLSSPRRVALFNDIFGESPNEYGPTPRNLTNSNSFLSDIKAILTKTSEIEVISSETTSPGNYTDIDSCETTPIHKPIETISSASDTSGKTLNDEKIGKENKSRDEIDDCFILNPNTERNFKTIACVDLTVGIENDMGSEIDYVEIPGLDLCSKKQETEEENKIKELGTCDKEETEKSLSSFSNKKFKLKLAQLDIEKCANVDKNQHVLIADNCAASNKTNDVQEGYDSGSKILNIYDKIFTDIKPQIANDIQHSEAPNYGDILIDKQDKTLSNVSAVENANELLLKVKDTANDFITEVVKGGDVVPLKNPYNIKETEQLLSANKSTKSEEVKLIDKSQINENSEGQSVIKLIQVSDTLDNSIDKAETFNAVHNELGLKSNIEDDVVIKFDITKSVKLISKDEQIISHNKNENSLLSENILSDCKDRKTEIIQVIDRKSYEKIILENNEDKKESVELNTLLLGRRNSNQLTKEPNRGIETIDNERATVKVTDEQLNFTKEEKSSSITALKEIIEDEKSANEKHFDRYVDIFANDSKENLQIVGDKGNTLSTSLETSLNTKHSAKKDDIKADKLLSTDKLNTNVKTIEISTQMREKRICTEIILFSAERERSLKDKDSDGKYVLIQTKSINKEQSDATEENISAFLPEEIGQSKLESPEYSIDAEIQGKSKDKTEEESLNEVMLVDNDICIEELSQEDNFLSKVKEDFTSKSPERLLKDEHSINVSTSEEQTGLDRNEFEAITKVVQMSPRINNETIEKAGPSSTTEKEELNRSKAKLIKNDTEAATSFSKEANPLNNKNSKVIVQSIELLPPIKIIQIENERFICPTEKNNPCSLTTEHILIDKENSNQNLETVETFSQANVVENDKSSNTEEESSCDLSENMEKGVHTNKICTSKSENTTANEELNPNIQIIDLCFPMKDVQDEKSFSESQAKNESSVSANSPKYNNSTEETGCKKVEHFCEGNEIEANFESLILVKTLGKEKEILNLEVLSCESNKTNKNSIIKDSLNENRKFDETLPQKKMDEENPISIIEQDIMSYSTSVFLEKSLEKAHLHENSQTVDLRSPTNIAENLEGISSTSQQKTLSNFSKIAGNGAHDPKLENEENFDIIYEKAEMLEDKAVEIQEENLNSSKHQQIPETFSGQTTMELNSFEEKTPICEENSIAKICNIDESISEQETNFNTGETDVQSISKAARDNKTQRTVSNSKALSNICILKIVAIDDGKNLKNIPFTAEQEISRSIEILHEDNRDYPESDNDSVVLRVSDLDLTDEIEETSEETQIPLTDNVLTNEINQYDQQEVSEVNIMVDEVHNKASTKIALTDSTASSQIIESFNAKETLNERYQNEPSINTTYENEKTSREFKENSFNEKVFVEATSSEATKKQEIFNSLSSEENKNEVTTVNSVPAALGDSCNDATKSNSNLQFEELKTCNMNRSLSYETATVISTKEAEDPKSCHANKTLISESPVVANWKEKLEKEPSSSHKNEAIVSDSTIKENSLASVLKANADAVNNFFANEPVKESSHPLETSKEGDQTKAKLQILEHNKNALTKVFADNSDSQKSKGFQQIENEIVNDASTDKSSFKAKTILNASCTGEINTAKYETQATHPMATRSNHNKIQKHEIADNDEKLYCENQLMKNKPIASKQITISEFQKNLKSQNFAQIDKIEDETATCQIDNCDLVTSSTNELKNVLCPVRSEKYCPDERLTLNRIHETTNKPTEFIDKSLSLTLQVVDESSQKQSNLKKECGNEIKIKEGIVLDTNIVAGSCKEVGKLGNSIENKEMEALKITNNESNLGILARANYSKSTNKAMQSNRSSPSGCTILVVETPKIFCEPQPTCERKDTKKVPEPSSYTHIPNLFLHCVKKPDHTSLKEQLSTDQQVSSSTEILSAQESKEPMTDISQTDRLVINTQSIPIVLQAPVTIQQVKKENEKTSPSLSLNINDLSLAEAKKINFSKKVVTKEINIEGEIVEVVKDIVDFSENETKTPSIEVIQQAAIISSESDGNPRDLALRISETGKDILPTIIAHLPESLPILPSISTPFPTPSNFSGIFSKTPSVLAVSEEESNKSKKKSLLLSNKPKEYIIPAASVLCNVDNLENATKTNKRLHWELLDNKNEMTEIEDDANIDTTDEEELKIKDELLENASNSPKQNNLQNVLNQRLQQKTSPSETDTQTEDESLLNDLRQQKRNYIKLKQSRIHKIKSKLPKNIKDRLKAIAVHNINAVVVDNVKEVQKPVFKNSSKRPVGRPRKLYDKEQIEDKLLQHKKRGRKLKKIVGSHTKELKKLVLLDSNLDKCEENQIVLKEDIHKSKSMEINIATHEPQTSFSKSAKCENKYLQNNIMLVDECDRNVFPLNSIENSVKSLSSSVEKLEICDEPCGSRDSLKRQISSETQTIIYRNEDDYKTLVYHKQHSSKDVRSTGFLEKSVKMELTPILSTENVSLNSLDKISEVALKSIEAQNDLYIKDCTNDGKAELLIKEETSADHNVNINTKNTLSFLQNSISSGNDTTNRSCSGSSEDQQEKSATYKSFTKHSLKKKCPTKFLSLEDIGINVRPPKVHLSTFRIPKIKKNPDDIIDNSWKLETYEEIKNTEDVKQTQENEERENGQGKVTQVKTHDVEKEPKDICQATFRADVSQDQNIETGQTKSNSMESVLKEDVQLKNGKPVKEKTSPSSKFILNIEKTKTGRRTLFCPDMYNECDNSRAIKTEDKVSEISKEQCLNVSKVPEIVSAKPRRKSVHFAAKSDYPDTKSIKNSTKPAIKCTKQQRRIFDSSANKAKNEKLPTSELSSTILNSKSGIIAKSSPHDETINIALKKNETNKPFRLYADKSSVENVVSADDTVAKAEKANSEPRIPVGQETAINNLELYDTNAHNCSNQQPSKNVKSFEMRKKSLNSTNVSPPTQLEEETDKHYTQNQNLPQNTTVIKLPETELITYSVNEGVGNSVTEVGTDKDPCEGTKSISSFKIRKRTILVQKTPLQQNEQSQEILEKNNELKQPMQPSSTELRNNVQNNSANRQGSKNNSMKEKSDTGSIHHTTDDSDVQISLQNRLSRRRKSTNKRNTDENKGDNNKNAKDVKKAKPDKIKDSTLETGLIPKMETSTVKIQNQPTKKPISQCKEPGADSNTKLTNELIEKSDEALANNSKTQNKHTAPAKETNIKLRRKSTNQRSKLNSTAADHDVATVHVKKDQDESKQVAKNSKKKPDTIQSYNPELQFDGIYLSKTLTDSTAEITHVKDIKVRRKSLSQAQNLKPESTLNQETQNDQSKPQKSWEHREDSKRQLNSSSNMEYDSDASVVLTRQKAIKLRRKSTTNQRRILDSSSEDETVAKKPNVITSAEETPFILSEKPKQRKRRIVKVLSTSMDSPNNSTNTSQLSTKHTSPFASPLFNHPIFNNEVSTQSAEFAVTLPMTPNQQDDSKLKEIDSKLNELFQSPIYNTDYKNLSSVSHTANLSFLPPTMNDSQPNLTIDETFDLNQQNDCSSPNVSLVNNSSISLNGSQALHNRSEVKHLSLGSADYRFEKVSDNVINLFISRKRKRKPKN